MLNSIAQLPSSGELKMANALLTSIEVSNDFRNNLMNSDTVKSASHSMTSLYIFLEMPVNYDFLKFGFICVIGGYSGKLITIW